MTMPRTLLIIALVWALCAMVPGCETTGKRSKSEKKTIDRQGVQAVAVLATYLFPRGWNEAMQVSMARRMLPLEYHGNTVMGKTLIQSKIEFDAGALQRLLVDTQRTTPTFTTDADMEHPFGKDSHQTLDDGGSLRKLAWWKPAKHKNASHYFWSTNLPNEPATRVWLQVADERRNVKLVYVRIESE